MSTRDSKHGPLRLAASAQRSSATSLLILILAVIPLVAGACGDDDNGQPDAGPGGGLPEGGLVYGDPFGTGGIRDAGPNVPEMDARTDTPDAASGSTLDGEMPDADAAPPPITCDELDCHILANCDESGRNAKCVCIEGFGGDGVTSCDPVNECDFAALNDCDANARCEDLTPGYACHCNQGYEGDGEDCVDVDECADDDLNDCHADAICSNEDGDYTCTCDTNFEGDGVTACDPIPFCDRDPYPCDENADCENVSGGYVCTCRDAYEGDGSTCRDKNECDYPELYPCPADAICRNTIGSYLCECADPTHGDDDGVCRPLCDIAKDDPEVCDPNARCRITTEGAVCDSCMPGYIYEDGTCTSDAGCEGLNCPANTMCVDNGGLACACAPGYEGDPSVGCTDINPCSGDHGCDATVSYCLNTAGGYMCVCNDGYSAAGGGTCEDIDECAEGLHLCEPIGVASCTNTVGGYDCVCPAVGYELVGQFCNDIDECAEGTDDCDDVYDDCYGLPPDAPAGSFTCRDKNECDPSNPTHDCGADSQCKNEDPGYSCPCDEGYAGDGLTSCYCDLSGYWAMRQNVLLSWGGPGIDDDSMYTTVWELHKYIRNEATGDLEMWKKGCSQADQPDIVARILSPDETYSSYVPRSVGDALDFWRGVDMINEPPSFLRPEKPGDQLVTQTDAAVMGIDLGSDPVNADWPTWAEANAANMWVDMEGDGEPGLTLWMKNPGDPDEPAGGYFYMRVDADGLSTSERSACLSSAARIKSWLEGELIQCMPLNENPTSENSTLIEGDVINAAGDAENPNPASYFISCTLVPEPEWDESHDPCDSAHWAASKGFGATVERCTRQMIDDLNDLTPTQTGEACFELVKIAGLSDPEPDCNRVRTLLPAYPENTPCSEL